MPLDVVCSARLLSPNSDCFYCFWFEPHAVQEAVLPVFGTTLSGAVAGLQLPIVQLLVETFGWNVSAIGKVCSLALFTPPLLHGSHARAG